MKDVAMNARVDVFFEPRSVAVVGASPRPDNMGRTILENLLAGFRGKVYVVNPRYAEVLGLPSYKSLRAVPDEVDLAVLAVSSRMTPEIMEDAGLKGVKGVVVFSGGFAETGTEEGRRLQDELVSKARKYGVRLLGPNCIGVYNSAVGLDTFFLPRSKMRRPSPGPIALVSQSGALLATLMDWAASKGVGVSKAINFGNKADVDEVESIEYLGRSDDVKVILLYLEGATRGRELVDVIRGTVGRGKHVVVIKGGRFQTTARATLSHTASVAGSYDVFKEAMREAGAILLEDLEAAFDAAKVLSTQPAPAGRRVAVITNSGGHGVVAADTLTAAGLEVPETTQDLMKELAVAFPERVSLRNPFDLTGDARPDQYRLVIDSVLGHGFADSLLVIALVQPPTMDPGEVVKVISEARAKRPDIPLVVVTIGADAGVQVARALEEQGIPVFELPDRAARALASLHMGRPRWPEAVDRSALGITDEAVQGVKDIIRKALKEGRSKLLEDEALRVLRLYGVPVADFCVARSEGEASGCASTIGGPVVMKVISPDIVHKADVGGVLVGVSPDQAADAFKRLIDNVRSRAPTARVEGVLVQRQASGVEVMVGGLRDPAFGPIVTFGLGGALVELIRDVSMRLAPVGPGEATEMVRETRAFALLSGYRGGAGANIAKVAEAVVRVSFLLADHNEIKELDINPILANQETATAVDARVLIGRGGG